MPTRDTAYFVKAIRQLSNTEDDPAVTDSEVTDRANEALSALYDLLVASYEHYAVRVYDFTLVGGVGANRAPLPTCFYKDVSLDLNPDTAPVTVHRFTSWVDRNTLPRRSYIVEGNYVVVGPAALAAGIYRLSYTPTPPVMAPRTTIDLSTGVNAVDGTLRSWHFDNATFTAADVGKTLLVAGAVNDGNNGAFEITSVTSATDVVTGSVTTLVSELLPTSAVIQYYVSGTIDQLPQIFLPWYEYIQVAGAIAVKDKIEQNTADLEKRLDRLTERVQTMAANRMEEGGQIALANRSGFWDDDVFRSEGDVYLPNPRKAYTITKRVGGTHGTLYFNQDDILVQVVADLVASGQWEVARSCDGATIAVGPTSLWTSYLSIAISGSGHRSWMTLRNKKFGWQFEINCVVNGGWLEVQTWLSPAAGFTGGDTTGVFPSATDQVQAYTGGIFMGSGPSGNPEFRAFTWVSTDGANTRIAWWQGGRLTGWWQIDGLSDSVGTPGSWKPVTALWFSNGNDYTTFLYNISARNFTTHTRVAVRTPANVVEDSGIAWDAQYFQAQLASDITPRDQVTLQYLWTAPFGLQIVGLAPPRNGVLGYLTDQWWGPSGGPGTYIPVFNNGDTVNHGQFMWLGQMLLPWDGTLNPPMGGAGTTDYPAEQFYGRDCAPCAPCPPPPANLLPPCWGCGGDCGGDTATDTGDAW